MKAPAAAAAVKAVKHGGPNPQRSLSPPKLPDRSISLTMPAKGAKGAKEPPRSMAITKQTPTTTIAKRLNKLPTKQGIKTAADTVSSDDDRSAVVYIRTAGIKKKAVIDFDGKFVIPKILQEPVLPRRKPGENTSDLAAPIVDTGAYAMMDRSVKAPASAAAGPPRRSSVRERDRSISQRSISQRKAPPPTASLMLPAGKKDPWYRRVMGKTRQGSELSSKSQRGGGTGSFSEGKTRRRWIRNLLNDENQYGDPPCCPRIGLLCGIWLCFAIIVVVLMKYMLEVEFNEPTMIVQDNDTAVFIRTRLVEL